MKKTHFLLATPILVVLLVSGFAGSFSEAIEPEEASACAAPSLFESVFPAALVGGDQAACEAAGGVYTYQGCGDFTCDIQCDTGNLSGYYSGSGPWSFPSCPATPGELGQPERYPVAPVVEVSGGSSYDISFGNCGMTGENPNFSGTVTLQHVGNPPNSGGVDFVNSVCKSEFSDGDGNSVGTPGGLMTVYVNLNAQTRAQWDAGDLTIYYFDGSQWQACANPILVEQGEYGRLACVTSGASMFGLGKK